MPLYFAHDLPAVIYAVGQLPWSPGSGAITWMWLGPAASSKG